jgi:hypothetical protein
VRLLLLGKAAVLAHRYERPLAAEMDEQEQRAARIRTSVTALPLRGEAVGQTSGGVENSKTAGATGPATD